MINRIYKPIVLLAFFGIFASTNLYSELETIKGAFLIDGTWHKGFLTAESISVNEVAGRTVITASAPYTLMNQSGKVLEFSKIRTFKVEYDEAKGNGIGNN